MSFIRWEISEQLDYVPSIMKVLVHKRAVYVCPKKHNEATLITPKPRQPIIANKSSKLRNGSPNAQIEVEVIRRANPSVCAATP